MFEFPDLMVQWKFEVMFGMPRNASKPPAHTKTDDTT